jgi:hypothetical protein
MDVTGNSATNEGTYNAIVTLTNPNYVWSDGTSEDVVLSYTIAPLVLKKPTLVDKTYTYNGEVQILELENYLEERMNIIGNIQTEAGKYEVIISLDNPNYTWEDGTKDNIKSCSKKTARISGIFKNCSGSCITLHFCNISGCSIEYG